MNLFVVGRNLSVDLASSALSALRRMTAVYPQLDETTLWSVSPHASVFAACMSTGREAAAPRRYVAEDEAHLAFYDGCLIDGEGRINAHDAASLLAHWDTLPDRLEGQFAAFRTGKHTPTLEMITDPLGTEQVYVLENGDTWIVSNSAGLIGQVADPGGLDFRGASQLLTMGWVGSDRTLRERVRLVPGGQLWRWLPGRASPEKRTYCGRAELSPPPGDPKRRLHRGPGRPPVLQPAGLRRVADDLVRVCQILGSAYGDLYCGLTAGRDSRTIAALLTAGRVPARYHTSGAPGSVDIEIASRIAAELQVPHEIDFVTDAEVSAAWERCCRDLVRQNDGMVNLLQAPDLLRQPARIERLKLSLWGHNVGVARAGFYRPSVVIRRWTWQGMKELIGDWFVDDDDDLTHTVVRREARAVLDEFADQVRGEGYSPIEVMSLFNICDRTPRWGGANARKAMPAGERFSPFATRVFTRACFTLPPAWRHCEPFHYGLTRMLAPVVHRMPCDKGPWRGQHPALNFALWLKRKAAAEVTRLARGLVPTPAARGASAPCRIGTFDHGAWLETKREWWRSLCLDQAASPAWDLVDRRVVERLAAPETPALERRRRMRGLYNVITLMCYEAEFGRGGVRDPQGTDPAPLKATA